MKEQHLSNVSDKLRLGKRFCAIWTRISLTVFAVTGKENQKEEKERNGMERIRKSRRKRIGDLSHLKSRLISSRKCVIE